MTRRMRAHEGGFTLIELMIVVAIISVIASMAIPNLLRAKRTTNEGSAIAALRNIASVQVQCANRTFIDSDNDGQGEYGYFGELTGAVAARNNGGAILPPALLGGSFMQVNNGAVNRSGYLISMFLPDNTAVGLPESAANYANVDPDLSEQIWCAYAWPADSGGDGNVYFINQSGEILRSQNTAGYGGLASPPPFDAAFLVGGDMSNKVAAGVAGVDGSIWNALR